jgi:hypothetical protein
MVLTSEVDDENFKQLKSMTVSQGRAYIHFQVLAVARYLGEACCATSYLERPM